MGTLKDFDSYEEINNAAADALAKEDKDRITCGNSLIAKR